MTGSDIRRDGVGREDEDALTPGSDEYIGLVNLNRRAVRRVRSADLPASDIDSQLSIGPNCRSGKGLAITALGYLYPCTNCESSETDSWFYRNREHFNLRKLSIREILASEKWRELEYLWQRSSTAPGTCAHTCGVHRDYRPQYEQAARKDRPNKPDDVIRIAFDGQPRIQPRG